MTEETENLVLEMLRRIRASGERVEEELTDIKLRLSAVEQAVGLLTSMVSQLQVSMAAFQRRADRLDMRTDTVESRLERLEGRNDSTDATGAHRGETEAHGRLTVSEPVSRSGATTN